MYLGTIFQANTNVRTYSSPPAQFSFILLFLFLSIFFGGGGNGITVLIGTQSRRSLKMFLVASYLTKTISGNASPHLCRPYLAPALLCQHFTWVL